MPNDQAKGGVSKLFAMAQYSPTRWRIAIIASALGVILEAFPYISIYFIVREVLSATSAGEPLNATTLWIWGVLTLVILISSVACTLFGGYSAHKEAFRLIYGLRRAVLSHLGKLPMGYFTSTSTGEVQKTLETEMGKIEQRLAHNVPNLIGAGPLVIALLISMFILNPWLALVVVSVVALSMFIQMAVYSSKGSRATAVEMNKRMGAMNRWFNEYLRGISVVKIFGAREHSFSKLEDSIISYRDFLVDFTKKTSFPFSGFKVLMLSLLSFVLPAATALIQIKGGNFTLILTVLMFLIITPSLYSPMLELMRLSTDTQQANVAATQLEELLKQPPLVSKSTTALPEDFNVKFEHVSFSYQDASDPLRRWALSDVSLVAPAGTVTALVGPSGGGKSTAGQLLCRFWDVTSGSITIGGVDIRDMDLDNLMDYIAFVFQDSFIFSTSVHDNIAMNRPLSREDVEQAARDAMCHDFIMALPQGYDTILGDGGAHLSGGEAQRIAIARAIVKDSPIVVLDEATASTDAENETLIQQALERLLAGKTVFIIAHRLATIQQAHQIVVLRDGITQQIGTHQELISQPGLYQKLWDIQHDVEGWQLTTETKVAGEL